MGEPKVLVIMPLYNRCRLVAETLLSVLSQSYQAFEVVVSDDGSTDGSVDVVEEVFSRYSKKACVLLKAERNCGLAGNVNRLLEYAATRPDVKYVAYVDSDDLWTPDKLERQVGFMEAHSELVFSYHDVELIGDGFQGKRVRMSQYLGLRALPERGDVRDAVRRRLGTVESARMVRWRDVVSLRRDVRLKHSDDYLFEVELLAGGGVCGSINRVLGYYRKHEGNLSRKEESVLSSTEDMLVALGVIEARYPFLFKAIQGCRHYVAVVDMVRALNKGDYERAYHVAVNGVRGGYGLDLPGLLLGYRLALRFRLDDALRSLLGGAVRRYVYR
jgi:teichuronic acid biosynthesis glycosyltransferase TuaG